MCERTPLFFGWSFLNILYLFLYFWLATRRKKKSRGALLSYILKQKEKETVISW